MHTRSALALALFLAGCPAPVDDTDTDTDTDTNTGPEPLCTEPTAVPCEDDIILELGLHDDKVSSAAIQNEAAGTGWVTSVDATAGGFTGAAENPWLYAKFTDTGIVRVDIDDVTALTSMDWQIAFKRYNIRVNGGVSGPSCVGVVPLLEADYDNVSAVPDGVTFRSDEFFTETCEYVEDSFGLGGPQVAMGAWWSYESCVKTTGAVFIVELDDGKYAKLVVDQYYGEGQEECNTNGTPGAESANLKLRWAYL